MSETLPKGWVDANICEISNIVYGKGLATKDISNEGQYPVFGANSVIGFHNSYLYKKPQVLISCRGANSGTINISPEKCHITSNSLVLELPEVFYNAHKFIFYSLVSVDKSKIVTGTAQPQVTIDNLKSFTIPLPPLNEQKRIVAKLDQIISRIDAVKGRLDKVSTIVKRFRQSVLTAAVTGKLTEKWRAEHPEVERAEEFLERINKEGGGIQNHFRAFVFSKNESLLPDSWIQITTEQINAHITKGTTPKNSGFCSSGIPYLKVYNIVDNKINFEYKPQFVSKELHTTFLSRSKVFPGDILMNIVGPPLGKIAIVPETHREWNINQAIAIFRTKKMILNQYLYLVLTEGDCLAKILIETRGVVGQSNLSLEQCRSLLVNLPPMEEQKEIVRQVNKLFTLSDRLESHYQKAKARVDKLSQSLLAKAFRGELVVNEAELSEKEGRDFESAEKLLERILEEKANLVSVSNSKNRKTMKKMR